MASTGHLDGHLEFQGDSQESADYPTSFTGQCSTASRTTYCADSVQTTNTAGLNTAALETATLKIEESNQSVELAQSLETYTQAADSSSMDSTGGNRFTIDEKFELLSAYLDDEVTEEERALVNHWLASDPEMQDIYQKQRQLQAAIKELLS